MLSTWAEARAQAEVVDAEGDGGEEQAEQCRDGPVDGVVVQGGLNHLLHSGKQFASLEPIDRVVPEQTDGFVQEGQVPFEDGQLLEVEIDEMRIDIQILLLFGCSPGVTARIWTGWRLRSFDESRLERCWFRKSSGCDILPQSGRTIGCWRSRKPVPGWPLSRICSASRFLRSCD